MGRRLTAAALAALALGGCGGHGSAQPEPLADRLDRLGFFDLAPAARRREFRDDVRRNGADAVFVVETGRLFAADSEALAEGGVDDELRELRPVLARLHVRVPPVRERFVVGGEYTVRVGRRAWTIYTAPEERASEPRIWELSLARTTRLLNALLAGAGSDERFYAVGGGNDGWLFLLTPAMRDAIRAALPEDDPERPYTP